MYAYSNIEYNYQLEEERIEWEMHNFKKQAVQALESLVAHPKISYSELIIRLLSYGYFDSHPDAIKLSNELNLGKLHFLASMEDYEAFKEEYEESQNFRSL